MLYLREGNSVANTIIRFDSLLSIFAESDVVAVDVVKFHHDIKIGDLLTLLLLLFKMSLLRSIFSE